MKVRGALYTVDPYESFESNEGLDLHGWGVGEGFLSKVFEEAKVPVDGMVVEVGSWKGRSADVFARLIKKHAPTAELVCIDTWLGAAEFWTDRADPVRFKSLRLRNGYPTVYYTFLNNMRLLGHSSVVTPFPQTSTSAAEVFAVLDLHPDLLFIDGSHSYEDVSADLRCWYPLVKSGGIICGDDYNTRWPGVMKAVDEFVKNHELSLGLFDQGWFIKKV